MKKIVVLFALSMTVIFSAAAQVDVKVPSGMQQVIDNFEKGNYWIWAGFDWERYSGHKASWGCNLSGEHVTEGKYSMELLIEPVKPGANALWFYDGTQNLSGGRYIAADFYNAGPYSVKISFVLQATDDWIWLETPSYSVPPGKHKVVFPVEHLNQKFSDVKRINVNANFDRACSKDTSLFVDNIILIK